MGVDKKIPNSESRIEIAYERYPKEVENGNGVWRVSGHIDKLKEEEIKNERLFKNFLTQECGGKSTAMGKSVLFRTQKSL